MAMKDWLRQFKGKQTARPKAPDPRELEKKLRMQLARIDLEDPGNRLSREKIHELRIPGVVRYVSERLRYPQDPQRDVKRLHEPMIYIADALWRSVREGLELTAEWACAALFHALGNLSMDCNEVGSEYADAFYQQQVANLENWKMLLQACIDHDSICGNLRQIKERRRVRAEELDACVRSYRSRQDSGQIDQELAELQMFAHEPSRLSDSARALQEELLRIRMLKDSVSEMDGLMAAWEANLAQSDEIIRQCREQLSMRPWMDGDGHTKS